ncbi:hypothetical protein GCM10023235_53770 [Kitasatospora terrestris]|uniref:Uncharacterized protein n=1 Tax=Kitasatospora terrestris TaxID=258051 RepID=A0ABP9E4S3_9ACTN
MKKMTPATRPCRIRASSASGGTVPGYEYTTRRPASSSAATVGLGVGEGVGEGSCVGVGIGVGVGVGEGVGDAAPGVDGVPDPPGPDEQPTSSNGTRQATTHREDTDSPSAVPTPTPA